MANTKDRSYGNPSWVQKIGAFVTVLLHMPFVLIWTLLTSPFHPNNRHKTWRRVVGDKTFHLTSWFSVKQLQWHLGTSLDNYRQALKAHNLPEIIDELEHDARLFWIGERRTDRVILYIHGGAFIMPMQYCALNYWRHLQTQIKKNNGHDVGLVVLNYRLVPTATFPAQLKQAVTALKHLLSTGLSPRNLQIVGDSAGANLVLQLISHILHPIPEVPSLTLPSPLCGVFLMSPWVTFTSKVASMATNSSMVTNDKSDCISRSGILYWGATVLDGVPESMHHYIETVKVPDDWFNGIASLTNRLLITAGDAECLRDDIIILAKKIEASWAHSLTKSSKNRRDDMRFVLQENGVHDDPHLDFLLKEEKLTSLSWEVVNWVADGFD